MGVRLGGETGRVGGPRKGVGRVEVKEKDMMRVKKARTAGGGGRQEGSKNSMGYLLAKGLEGRKKKVGRIKMGKRSKIMI